MGDVYVHVCVVSNISANSELLFAKNEKKYATLKINFLCMQLCAQLCLTLCNPMDCSLPGSSAHGIFQARLLEWIAISCSRMNFLANNKEIVYLGVECTHEKIFVIEDFGSNSPNIPSFWGNHQGLLRIFLWKASKLQKIKVRNSHTIKTHKIHSSYAQKQKEWG